VVEGVFPYRDVYLKLFIKNYQRFKSLQGRIDKKCVHILKPVVLVDVKNSLKIDVFPAKNRNRASFSPCNGWIQKN